MAASATVMQCFLSSPAAQWSTRAAPSSSATSGLLVKCSVEKGKKGTSAQPTITPPATAPKVSTRFSDLMAFDGPALELINGHLAMLGFVAAIAVELSSGSSRSPKVGCLSARGVDCCAVDIASLVTLLKGVSVQSKSDGVMTSDAEMWNGRFAMLGLVALALTEFVNGEALV